MKTKLKRKIMLLGIICSVVVALVVAMAGTVMAAPPNGITRGKPGMPTNQGLAMTTGNLTSTSAGISISTTVALPPVTAETVTILSNSTAIQSVMNSSSPSTFTPKIPSNLTTTAGSLTSTATGGSSTINVTVTTSPSPLPAITTPEKVTILYNKTTGSIQSVMGNIPGLSNFTQKNPPNQGLAMTTGNLTSTSAGISISTTVALPPVTAETVTILSNSTAIQSVMNSSSPSTFTPKIPSNLTTTAGSLTSTAAGGSSTINVTVTTSPSPLPAITTPEKVTTTHLAGRTCLTLQDLTFFNICADAEIAILCRQIMYGEREPKSDSPK